MLSNCSTSEKLEALYMSQIGFNVKSTTNDAYMSVLKQFVSTIEEFIDEHAVGNPKLYKHIAEGNDDYYMKKGDKKVYFKRHDIPDIESASLEDLEAYVSYVDASFHEDDEDNLVFLNQERTPFINDLFGMMRLQESYQRIKELQESKK